MFGIVNSRYFYRPGQCTLWLTAQACGLANTLFVSDRKILRNCNGLQRNTSSNLSERPTQNVITGAA
jgi:hypothetical protein